MALGPGGPDGAGQPDTATENTAVGPSAESTTGRGRAEAVAGDAPAPRPERAAAGAIADDGSSAETAERPANAAPTPAAPGPGEPVAARPVAADVEAAAPVERGGSVAAVDPDLAESGELGAERPAEEGGERSGDVAAAVEPEREAEAGEEPPATEAPESALHRARLRIVSEPEGADIWLGDDRIGHTPFDGEIESASDTAELSVRAHGYRSWHETAVLAGEVLEYEIALRRRAPEATDDEGEAGPESAAEGEEDEGEEPAEVDPFGLTQTY
jgi:hypothetical protein